MSSYDDFADTFAASRSAMRWSEIDHLCDHVSDTFSQETSLRILDVGCGNGRLIDGISMHSKLSPKTIEYVGLDSSSELLKHAQQKQIPTTFTTSCIHADMRELEKSIDGQFDVIFFVASFHHLTDTPSRIDVLGQAKKLLTKGGIICMTNWYLHSDENTKKYESSVIKTYPDGSKDYQIKIGEHVRFYHGFTIDSIAEVFEKVSLLNYKHSLGDRQRNIISCAS